MENCEAVLALDISVVASPDQCFDTAPDACREAPNVPESFRQEI